MEKATSWDVKFDLLGAVRVPGMRAEVRMFTQTPADERPVEVSANVLSLYTGPENAGTWASKNAPSLSQVHLNGPLIFWPRSVGWKLRSAGHPSLAVVSYFDDDFLDRRHVQKPCSVTDLAMVNVMRLLRDEIQTPGFASVAMFESIAEILRVKLSRLFGNDDDLVFGSKALRKSRLALIREYVDAQRGNSPSVTELATQLGTSRRSLLRWFKATTGMTVSDYIKDVQISKAKSLILTSGLSLKEVAYETGFTSLSNFSIAFKRNVGVSPRAFRG